MSIHAFVQQGTSKIHGVSLEMCDLSDTLRIGSSVFRPMRDLTFLKFLKHVVDITSKLQLISDVSSITHGLKLLHWDAYPLETLPFSFQSSTLVEINLRYSNLKHFWDETKVYRSKVRYFSKFIFNSLFIYIESICID